MRRRALSQYGFHCSHCTASIRKNTDFYRCKPQGIFACYLIRHLTPGSQSTHESAIQSAQNCPADSGFLSECSQLEESRSPSVQKQDGKEDGVSSSVQVETHAFCIEGWNLKKTPHFSENDFKQFDMTSFMTLISDPRFGQFEDGGWSFAFNFHIFALICFQVPPLNQMTKCASARFNLNRVCRIQPKDGLFIMSCNVWWERNLLCQDGARRNSWGRMNLGSLLLCLSRSTTSDSRKTHLSYLDRKANEFAEELRCLVAPWDWNYCEVCGTGLTTIWFPYCRNQRYNVAQFHYPVSPWMKCNTLHFPQLQMDSVKKNIDLILPKCDAKRFV